MYRSFFIQCTLVLCTAVLLAGGPGAVSAAGEPKSKAPVVTAEDLRALANLYAELQKCRDELRQLSEIEKKPIEEFRAVRVAELEEDLKRVKQFRKSKSFSEDYLNATAEPIERELKYIRAASKEVLLQEREKWLAAHRDPIEARMKDVRLSQAQQRARMLRP